MKHSSHPAVGARRKGRLLSSAALTATLAATSTGAHALGAAAADAQVRALAQVEAEPAPMRVAQLPPAPRPTSPGTLAPPAPSAPASADGVVRTQRPAAEGRANPTGRDVPLTAPLRQGEFILGEIDFILGADDSIRIGAAQLTGLLRPILEPAAFQALEATIAGRTQVPATDLAALGLAVTYDPATISLAVAIPPEARARQTIRLVDGSNAGDGPVIAPASLSAYMTARGSLIYEHTGDDAGFGGAFFVLDGAARYRGFVLENEAIFQSEDDDPFQRQGTRVVYDDLQHTARYTVGDLRPATRGFSGSPPLAGISVLRSYTVLDPLRNIQPRGDRNFTVLRPSTVEARVNGQSVRRIRVEPGTYNIRDFPLTEGSNQVELVITDDTGASEVISFSSFFSRAFLEPGQTEFGLFAGVQAPFEEGTRQYTSRPAASGFYRRGLSERLTGGANFQAQEEGVVAGVEALYGTRFANIGVDLAASQVDGIGSGAAVNVGVELSLAGADGDTRGIGLFLEARTEDFSQPGAGDFRYPYQYEAGVTYGQSLGPNQFVSIDARHSAARDGERDRSAATLAHNWRVSNQLFVRSELRYDNGFGEQDFGARVGFTYRLGARSSVFGDLDSRDERGRLGYQTSRGRGVGAWNASVEGNVGGQGDGGVNASFSQILNRAEYSVSHATAVNQDGGDTDRRTFVTLGTAVAYADGRVAASRPIYDGFVMAAPHRTLRNAPVLINPDEEGFDARSGVLGPAVDNLVTAFIPRTVIYDVPTAPSGYDIGTGAVRIDPPYRAGYLVEVGSDYSVTAIGRMLDDDGQPVALLAGRAFEVLAGQAYEVAKPDREPVLVLTNRQGRFAAQGLRPGRWRIEMPTTPKSIFYIDVPATAEGLVRLGDLKPGSEP